MPKGKKPSPIGLHRVVEPIGVLPQEARRLDNSLPIFENEILIEVTRLNIDSASFSQMRHEFADNKEKIAQTILQNCRTSGKQQNRITGSGGMLTGRVAAIGKKYNGPLKAEVGDTIATLVSLTLTPLFLSEVISVDLETHQLEVRGHAILFERSIASRLPHDLHPAVATSVLDVAGAPASVYSLAKRNQTIVLIGAGGKAGILSAFALRKKLGKNCTLIGVEPNPKAAESLRKLEVLDKVFQVDATQPVSVYEAISRYTHHKMADLVIQVASSMGTENSALLSVKKQGTILFFSMATQFSKVALGAEALAVEASLLFGNGYFPKHAEFALQLLRDFPSLRKNFYKKLGIME